MNFGFDQQGRQQVPVKLSGVDIPINADQDVTLIAAVHPKNNQQILAAIANHSAGRFWFVRTGSEINKAVGLEGLFIAVLIGLVCLAIGWWLVHFLFGLAVCVGIIGYKFFRVTSINKQLDAHIAALG